MVDWFEQLSFLRFGCGLLEIVATVFLLEFLHPPGRINELLLPGIERMATRTNLHPDLRLGAPRLKRTAATAFHLGVYVLRMNFRFLDHTCVQGFILGFRIIIAFEPPETTPPTAAARGARFLGSSTFSR